MPSATCRVPAVFLGLLLVVIAVAPAGAARPGPPPTVVTRVVELGPLKIDGIYHSMEGVFQRAILDTADIGWITAFRTEVVDAATGVLLGDKYFCHSQIQLATGAGSCSAGIPDAATISRGADSASHCSRSSVTSKSRGVASRCWGWCSTTTIATSTST